MRRREFIGLVGSVAATWPLAARAQQSTNVRRVGVLFAAYSEADRAGQARITAFTKSLDGLGWGESRIRIDYRWAAGNGERLRAFATELTQSAPDVIIAAGDPALSLLHRLKSISRLCSRRCPSRSTAVLSRALPARAATSPDFRISNPRWVASGSVCSRRLRPA